MEDGAARRPRKQLAAGQRAAVALLAIPLLAGLGLWTQRKPIARRFVDAEFRVRGVPAKYRIVTLGPGVQRLRGVVIGDPAAPDLVADELVVRLRYGIGWPQVTAVEGRGVRLRGRLAGGRLSFGAVDRLLPPPGDAPFALPDLRLRLTDAKLALATPAGAVRLDLAGEGGLGGGFAGRIAARAASLSSGGCMAGGVTADMAVRITSGRPRLAGPLAVASIECARISLARPRLSLVATFERSLEPRILDATLVTGRAVAGGETAAAAHARVTYDAIDARNRHGVLAIAAEQARTRYGAARRVTWRGPYRIGGAVGAGRARPLRLSGDLAVLDAAIPAGAGAAGMARGLAGTPLAPIMRTLGAAVATAARAVDLSATLAFDGDIGGRTRPIAGEVRVTRAAARSRSGARADFSGRGAWLSLADGAWRIDGAATLSGGGLPDVRITARKREAEGALAGTAAIAPYAAGGARLALTPVRFGQGRGGLVFATAASIDGPLADGSIRGLTVPLSGRLGRVSEVNAACVPLTFTSLAIAGMTLGETRLPLCPVGGAMLRIAGGRANGGMAVPQPRLAGRVGRQPLAIAGADLRVDIGRAGFAVDRMRMRLGGEGGTRLDVARLDGRIGAGGVGGRFGGAEGAIANVPLLLTRGEGAWRLAAGRLGLTATATVSDAAAAPRFYPLSAPDIALDLKAGVIRVAGSLREPRSGVRVTDVAIRHDLRDGTGGATLTVPGITFGPSFQPEAITRLTLGIVANVAGTVGGEGRIDWGRAGVTSSGDFETRDLDLAAAFGPVTGIATKIRFSDLLKLETPPGQIVTVAAFNPGIAVEGGVVGYQLLEGQKVAVGGGKWPFFGGALILEPTVLDFGQPVERRMTFRVEGLDAARFLERFDFRNVAATGLFDGSLPMIFDGRGGRISGGRLVVRPPGGTLAYVGELTNKDLGMFGKLAFDALKSIRYSNLAIVLDGALDGEIVSRIVFTGTNENPKDRQARGWLKDLTGLPFRFNIVIRAPFRGLTSSAEAFVNPRGLIGGAARGEGEPPVEVAPVKPPLSRNVR